MATKQPVKKIKLENKSSEKKTKKVEAKTISVPIKTKLKHSKKAAKIAVSPVTGLAGYVKGSWEELKLVRWPDRSATWGLTLAVIIFTLFFTLLIVGLDAIFQYLFKEVLLK